MRSEIKISHLSSLIPTSGHSLSDNTAWHIANHSGARSHHCPLSDEPAGRYTAANPYHCSDADMDPTGYMYSWRQVRIIPNHAIVVHGGRGVEDYVIPKRTVRVDDRPGSHHHSTS